MARPHLTAALASGACLLLALSAGAPAGTSKRVSSLSESG